jgi:hypothetical protein
VGAGAAELESLNQASLRQRLAWRADDFAEADVACKNAHYVRASGYPDEGFVFLGFKFSAGVNAEQLGVQWPLE